MNDKEVNKIMEERAKMIMFLAEYYGRHHQIIKAIEEHSELIQALSKYWSGEISERADEKTLAKLKKQIVSEYADCWITIAQVVYLLDVSSKDVEKMIKYKLKRQLRRIAECNTKSSLKKQLKITSRR